MLGKVIRWAIVLFIIFYVATQPAGAAGIVHHAYNGLHRCCQLHGHIRELTLSR